VQTRQAARSQRATLRCFVSPRQPKSSKATSGYNAELGGAQGDELAALAAKLIPGYPGKPTGGNAAYINALRQLDSDMPQYISVNTEDELSHEVFLNTYLEFKGARGVNLDKFRTLPSSQATGRTRKSAGSPI
jgi:hypothetical protein